MPPSLQVRKGIWAFELSIDGEENEELTKIKDPMI